MTCEEIRIEGDVVSGTGFGEIARAATFEQAPVSLELELDIEAALTRKLRAAGLRMNRNGPTRIRVSGTVSQPTTR